LCQSSRTAVSPHYVLVPKNFSTIVDDFQLAAHYFRCLDEANAQFRPLADLLPSDGNPTDAVMWKRVLDSIQAAEQLGKLTRSLPNYQDSLCQEGALDLAKLTASANDLEAAHQKLMVAIIETASRATLFPTDSAPGDLIKRPLTELIRTAAEMHSTLNRDCQCLASLLPVLRPGADIDVEALPFARSSLEGARTARAKLDSCDQSLTSLGVNTDHGLSDGGLSEAQWLQHQAAEGVITPLVQSVASVIEVRDQVTDALETIRNSAGTEFRASLKFLWTIIPPQAETGCGTSISQMPVGLLAEFLSGLVT
jgi:hypothetical protein